MKVNFIVENSGPLKYLGCATAAQQFLEILENKDIDIKINSKKRDFNIIHAHTFGPFAIMQTMKNKNAIKIISAHSTPSINKNNIIFGRCKFWNKIYSSIYNRFDYVFAVSDFSVKELKKIGVDKEIYVVENGVNTGKFNYDRKRGEEFRREIGLDAEDLVVLNVAQVTPRKGVYDFIEIAKKMPDVEFVWVGSFPYKFVSSDYFKLKKIAENNADLDNLKFVGFIPDIIGAYSGSDVLFTPTFAETFGLTIIEAGACKLPVVARELNVFNELFERQILYGSNCEEFIEAINKFKDKKFRERQIKKVYTLSKKYDMQIVADKLFKLYGKLQEIADS